MRIHAEWIDALIRERPDLERARLEQAAKLMNAAVLDCLVTDFESLEPGLTALPDADDRHVLAAAIHCGAQEIVTFNLRDFPERALRPYGIRAIHPESSSSTFWISIPRQYARPCAESGVDWPIRPDLPRT